jgi:UDP-N-acetylmuramate--alanine ligase
VDFRNSPHIAHFTGVGGAGMRSLARVLLQTGWHLSGSDVAIECDDPLAAAGVQAFAGHAAANVSSDVELVVRSSAIPDANVELRRAAELGIPVVSYADLLGMLMRGRRGLAVAGTHGKSTTAAMMAEIFMAAGSDPTYVFGAEPFGAEAGGRAGIGPIVLVEACEYQRNFLKLRPHDAVILNVEPDHFDCYPDREALEEAFCRFAALLPSEGTLIVPKAGRGADFQSDEFMAGCKPAPRCRLQTFGLSDQADWHAANVRSDRARYSFDLMHRAGRLTHVELAVHGKHNVLNALAAAALANINGCSAEAIAAGLASFRGLRRRLECIHDAGGITIWNDYAHHPTEISTALATIREISPNSRMFAVFQPHQASRTARLLDELAQSLQNAERVLIADIFRAREGPPQPGEVTAADLAARTRSLGHEVFGSHALTDIQHYLQTHLMPGDVLLVMGAGDIGRIGYGLVDWFREHCAAG